ncbi:MAG: DUF1269 domain-containing protein [Deltaproteobacteria bacterium]|nr:DUF1269 domain-containing protein [Deltaproteobacteria bacterium]
MSVEKESALVATFNTHVEAEVAVKELDKSGFEMKKLSIIGKDYHEEDDVIGYYNTGSRMKTWGKFGAFWGSLWGFLVGSAFFVIPGLGPIVVGGPLVGWIIGALEGATVGAGFGVVGAALAGIGIPKDSVLRYESSLKANHFLLVVHGTTQEVVRAREIVQTAGGSVDVHDLH